MHATFFRRISRGEATVFSRVLFENVQRLEVAIKNIDALFRSPLTNASLHSWGDYAHTRTPVNILYQELEHWYEALKLLVVSWEEAEDLAVVL